VNLFWIVSIYYIVFNEKRSLSKILDPKITLKEATVSIPIFSNTNTIKRKILNGFSGGKISVENKMKSVLALNSISCKLYGGEKVALIGHNGAGKTSFIRTISGIYKLTSGFIERKVDVYPMIERSFIVEEELTGYDSAKAHYLIMNNSLDGFEDFLDYVIQFSGIGEYLYLPLKTYSEGMASRLTFSLLTFHKHDCLALDEAIGTGDQNFYKKAQKRLNEYLTSSGMLILSSHSSALLRRFCERGLVFSSGSIIFDGNLEDALRFYDETNN